MGNNIRLTKRLSDRYWVGEEFWVDAEVPSEEDIDKVYDRLAAYEDLFERWNVGDMSIKELEDWHGRLIWHVEKCNELIDKLENATKAEEKSVLKLVVDKHTYAHIIRNCANARRDFRCSSCCLNTFCNPDDKNGNQSATGMPGYLRLESATEII